MERMHSISRSSPLPACLALAWACLAGPALAQGAGAAALVPPPPQLSSLPAAPAPVLAAASAASAASAPQARLPANPNRRVSEDDNVRIEETRVRGQLQRITVHNKATGKDYEILVGPGGRDPSQKRDAAGQPAWSVLSF